MSSEWALPARNKIACDCKRYMCCISAYALESCLKTSTGSKQRYRYCCSTVRINLLQKTIEDKMFLLIRFCNIILDMPE